MSQHIPASGSDPSPTPMEPSTATPPVPVPTKRAGSVVSDDQDGHLDKKRKAQVVHEEEVRVEAGLNDGHAASSGGNILPSATIRPINAASSTEDPALTPPSGSGQDDQTTAPLREGDAVGQTSAPSADDAGTTQTTGTTADTNVVVMDETDAATSTGGHGQSQGTEGTTSIALDEVVPPAVAEEGEEEIGDRIEEDEHDEPERPAEADVTSLAGDGPDNTLKGQSEEVGPSPAVREEETKSSVDQGDPDHATQDTTSPKSTAQLASGNKPIPTPNLTDAQPKPTAKGKPKGEAKAKAPNSTDSSTATSTGSKNKQKEKDKGSSTPLAAAADTATPAAAGNAKKGVKGKGKTKVEELKLKSAGKPRSSSSGTFDPPRPPTPTTPTKPASTAVTPSPKNAVYCVCRKPYAEEEEDITMLGCESCDNWFHPGCIGLTEQMVELLDVYICKSCERNTAQRTIYKQVCKRDGCMVSVAGSTSKFCSPSCAFQHSSSLISSMNNKNTLKQLAKTFISYPQPHPGVKVISHRPRLSPTRSTSQSQSQSDEDEAGLRSLQTQIERVERSITIVRARQEILRGAIERCEALHPRSGDEPEEDKRGKKKKSAGTKDDKPCGWVRGLVVPDEEVMEWAERARALAEARVQGDNGQGQGDGEAGTNGDPNEQGAMCYNGRRKCDRHQGWQKTMAVSLDVEWAGLERSHKNLTSYQDGLKSSMDSRRASNTVRDEFLQRRSLLLR